ncbi:TB2/DP1, HVA22 family-domain-containing protein [Mucidula mucida]|nr:TB2/DP1, HVA22 family-domain-containing protein [Mucidula mucida]
MFTLLFSALCAWFAFFLPCFATYKVLSQRPISEPELERISMYWSVIAAFVGFEYLAGWLVSWLPFYWEIKTVFFLFLSLPQTQGSTYVYNTYLKPFFVQNENAIEQGIGALQKSVINFVQTRFTAVWDLLWSVINKTPPPGQPPSAAPPSPNGAYTIENALGLWRTYGPSLVSALQSGKPAGHVSPVPSPASASSTSVNSVGVDRRTSGVPEAYAA